MSCVLSSKITKLHDSMLPHSFIFQISKQSILGAKAPRNRVEKV